MVGGWSLSNTALPQVWVGMGGQGAVMPPPLAFKNMFKRNSKLLTVDLIPYLGSQRRRLIPALSLDTPSPVRKPTNSAGIRWVDGPLRSTQRGLGEPFEIKVYEIDDVERLQRRRGGSSKVSLLHPASPQVPLSAPRGQCLRRGAGPGDPQWLPRGWEARAPAGTRPVHPAPWESRLFLHLETWKVQRLGELVGSPGFSGSSLGHQPPSKFGISL